MKKTLLLFVIIAFILSSSINAQWVKTSGPNNGAVYSLAISGSYIFAGTYNGFFYSTNSGNSWTQTSLKDLPVFCITISGNKIYAGTTDGIFLSTNNGTNWKQFNAFFVTIHSLIISGSNIYLGTDYKGVYRSTNNGTNWFSTPLNNKLVHALALKVSNNIIAGTYENGVYISTNNGNNWTQTSLNNKNINSILVSGNYIFAGTDNSGVLLTTNSGNTWVQTSLNNENVYCLYVNENNIFAGTSNGVYLSKNNGTNWILKNQGFSTTQSVNFLSIANSYIFAGTSGKYVWKRLFSEIIGIKNISSKIPSEFSLSQNYPNPFNPTTKIQFDIPKANNVLIKIYDIAGKEINTLVNEKFDAGTYETEWHAENYSSGVYFYTLTAGEFKETKRMILAK